MQRTPKFTWCAQEKINDGSTSRQNVEEIKKWLDQHPNIPKINEEQIVLFLIACKNDLMATTSTINSYFKCRQNAPEFFSNRHVEFESLKQTIEVIESAVMTNMTKDNYAVIFSRLKDTNYWNWNVESSIKYLFMCLDLAIQEHPVKGYIAVFDMKGLGLMHLTRLKVGPLRKFFAYLQEGLPCQLKEIHILNCTYIFDKLLLIIRPFMKKELLDMLKTHQSSYDMNEFFEHHAPQHCIPEDYGGCLPTMAVLCKQTLEKFKQLRQFYDDDEQQVKLYRKEK
ncbi:alpha-tocopherol transfer protein-like [Aethina tumida]|uniref:alpha-tocopherol transfer protein-like n=1 Tax=Aethina tumida TaxID=116153 RepID=UPI002148AD26|nr:alpha-tocopherol transfer protein-like [Aethina tumida]